MTGERKKIEKEEFTQAVLTYYDRNKRRLPWRDSGVPYYIWLSEIMLQQTRVEAVKGYFDRFVKALPDIGALAECDEEYLLKLWEGLGYYSRARNLKKAARQIVEQFGGELPQDKGELLKLSGIGNYTAGAIASIAFGKKEVALDGNLIRVFSRVEALAEDFSRQSAKNSLEALIFKYLPEDRAGDFNQAVMDIGATVCLPNGKPLCGECPLANWCLAHAAGSEQSYPVKKEKKERKIEKRTVFIFQHDQKVLLQKRNQKGVLYGLWEFPSSLGHLSMIQVKKAIEEDFLLPKDKIKKIEPFLPTKHIFSHLEWDMISYWVILESARTIAEMAAEYRVSPERKKTKDSNVMPITENQVWADKTDIKERLSLPSAFKLYQKSVQSRL